MMNPPSSQILQNRVDIYVGIPAQDTEGGPQWAYPPTPTYGAVPSTVQYQDAIEDVAEQGRVTIINTYWIMFGKSLNLRPRAKVVWIDVTPAKVLFTDGIPPSEAGRQGQFTIRAIEKI